MNDTIIDMDNISGARPNLASSRVRNNQHTVLSHSGYVKTATPRNPTPRTATPRNSTPRTATSPRTNTHHSTSPSDNHGWTKQARSLVKMWTVQTSLNRKYHQREAARMDTQSKVLKIVTGIFGSAAAFVSFVNAAFTTEAYVHIILNITSGLFAAIATLLGFVLSTLNLDIDAEKNRQTAVQYGNISNEGQSLLVEQNESTMPLATDFLRRMKDLTYLIQLFGPPLAEQDGSDLPNLVLMKGLNMAGSPSQAPLNEYDDVFSGGVEPEHKKSRKELLNGILDDAADIKRRREALQAEEAELNDLKNIIAKKVGLKPSESSEYIAGGPNLEGEVTLQELVAVTQKLDLPLRVDEEMSDDDEYESMTDSDELTRQRKHETEHTLSGLISSPASTSGSNLLAEKNRTAADINTPRIRSSSISPSNSGNLESAMGGASSVSRYHNRVRIDADELQSEIAKRKKQLDILKAELDSRESQNRDVLAVMQQTSPAAPSSPVKKLVDRIRRSDHKVEIPHAKSTLQIIEQQRGKLEAIQAATDSSFYEDLVE